MRRDWSRADEEEGEKGSERRAQASAEALVLPRLVRRRPSCARRCAAAPARCDRPTAWRDPWSSAASSGSSTSPAASSGSSSARGRRRSSSSRRGCWPMIRSTSSDTFAIRAKLSISGSLTFGLLSTDGADHLVRIANQDRALLARALHRRLQPLREVHRRELLRARDARPRPRPRPDASISVDRAARRPRSAGSRPGRCRGRRRTRAGRPARPTARETSRSASTGIRFSVSSAVSRISRSGSSSSSTRIASCSCARGASVPCAASRRTSRSTSPRLKKSRSGVGPITGPAGSL